jgi:transcriptional regulator of heat shock response
LRTTIKRYLKKLGMSKYYDSSNYIVNRLKGTPSPIISDELETKLKDLFSIIQVPFKTAVAEINPQRKNFLSYSYTLVKLCQLIPDHDTEHIIQSLSLLKSQHKLYQQDRIWQHMCAQLNWPFIPSV